MTERVITSVSPEISKPKRSVGKNSIGKTTTASLSFTQGEEKHVPNYLRTSSSSCHDFCKYGVKHDLEVKKRRPVRQRLNKETTIDEKDKVSVVIQLERRKKDNAKLVPPQDINYGTKKPAANELNDLPPEKIIQVSDLPPEKIIELSDYRSNIAEESAQVSSDMKFDFPSTGVMTDSFIEHSPPSILTSNEFDEHKSTDPSEELSEKLISIKFDQKAMENNNDFSDLGPEEGSSAKPVVKLIVSSSIQHSSASSLHKTDNPTERNLEEAVVVELNSTFPIEENAVSTEHITSCGSEALPVEVLSMKPRNHNNVKSARKKLALDAEGSTEDSSMKRKAKLSTASAIGSPVYQEEGLAKEIKKVAGLSVDSKAKRDTRVIGVAERPEVTRQVKANAKSYGKEKTAPTIKKSLSSTKPEIQEKTNNNAATVAPTAVKKKALSAGKSANASTELASPMTPSLKISSRLITSGGLAQKTREKIIKVSDRVVEKALGQSLLRSLSVKSSSGRVSMAKLRAYRNVSSVSQGKIQTRAVKLGVKKESSNSSEPKSDKIVLRPTRKQKPPLLGGKDGVFGSKCEADISILRKGVTRRISSVSPKVKIDRQPRRTASVRSEDSFSTPHKLKFSRGRVVSVQQDNNAPRILQFRRAKMASDNHSAKGDKKGYQSRTDRIGVDSNFPISKAPTVILRHQDVQEKKDTQGLLNQVIEETASKLVETRKSKVKALVGAFETVISLQESKVAPLPVSEGTSDA
ncbi:hypothetical protein Cni_G08369 [Canna indica]|uniref:Calmodulin-binding domain-containing protein n=1 Tax=Canna indica TaxID=4628 RepID=A0AAQ3K0M6_9LILI|nr:hypothetical protein Cni_G08369 [Canna indica]